MTNLGKVKYIPLRGDIVDYDFSEDQKGKEILKRRPAVIISDYDFNKFGLAYVCPITSSKYNEPWEVYIAKGKITGTVLCNQLRAIDIDARNLSKKDKLSKNTLDKIRDILREII